MCTVHMGGMLHWFSPVTLSWLEPPLSFEISVGDSRTGAILHHPWIKFDLLSWIRPLVVPLKAAALLYRLLAGTGGVRGVVSRGALPLWECSLWTASGRVISLRSAVAPAPACVRGAWSLLCLFHGGSSFRATLCVQLPKTHLHIIQLCQACCLDFSPVWMCLKKVTEIKVLELFERCSLPVWLTVCHFPNLLVFWV